MTTSACQSEDKRNLTSRDANTKMFLFPSERTLQQRKASSDIIVQAKNVMGFVKYCDFS